MIHTVISSPIGDLLATASNDGLTGLYTAEHVRKPRPDGERADGPFAALAGQLEEYFAGQRRDFDVPLALRGTDFQLRVWRELGRIPFGETVSYAQLATRLGSPRAVRAVGLANGRNPVSLVVPCHRVIGSDGALTGYAGGLAVKRWLLDHEAALAQPSRSTGLAASNQPVSR